MGKKRTTDRGVVALLVGGGSAPGINTVISAVTIGAIRNGLKVIGIYDGFKWLAEEGSRIHRDHVRELSVVEVEAEHIHTQGGSILRTTRVNPTDSPEKMKRVIAALKKLKVDYLITIGGDDTIFTAMQLQKHQEARQWLSVIHIPKTIDNDLPLPRGLPTFGFETARHHGVDFVKRIMIDAQTTDAHCHVVVTMGRGAGFLALGIGKGAGAHLTLIPEEFRRGKITVSLICDIIEGMVIKRLASGYNHMVAVLAEGLLLRMTLRHLHEMFGPNSATQDVHGNIKLGEFEFGREVCNRLKNRCSPFTDISFVPQKVGYDVRGADPIPFDNDYCHDLGHGAVQALLDKKCGVLITTKGPWSFKNIPKLPTGRVRLRKVDTNGNSYKLARFSMTRLGREDRTPEQVKRLATVAGNRSSGEFLASFGYLMK